MQAVIMAGGKGTRLKNITYDEIPKSLVLVCDKPLIQWQIENLKDNGVDDIIVVVGHLGDLIKSQLGNSVRYYEESEPLGTAGALPIIKPMLEDDFIFVYGDLFFDIDFKTMMEAHQDYKGQGLMLVHPSSHPYDSNLIKTNNDGIITEILPKYALTNEWVSNRTGAGVYIFNKSIIDKFPITKSIDLERDVLPHLAYLYAYESDEYVKDLGTEMRYYTVCKDVERGIPPKRNFKLPQKAIFLDRDGTLNYENGYIKHESQFVPYPWTSQAIKLINESEYLAIVVTNQPVVARGECTIEELETIHKKMETLLGYDGAYLNDILYCPHHPDGGYPGENPEYKFMCVCRKPSPGMLYAAKWYHHLDLSQCWMIGNSWRDRETAQNAGVKSMMIPDDAENLLAAVQKILGE